MAGTNIYGQLVRAQFESSASDLTPAATGLVYYNSVSGVVKWYNGSAWKSVVIDGGTATNLSLSNTTTGASSALIQIPSLTTAEKNALVAPVTGRLVFDSTLLSLYVYNGTAWTPAGGGSALLAITTQAAHGFVTADLGAPLYLTAGGVYTKAKADASNTAEVIGLIGSILDVNTFNLVMAGEATVNTAVTGGAMVVGTVYYVSPTTAGLLTATEPTTLGHVSKAVGIAKTTTVLEFINMRGIVVGGTNALTTISFANNATTTIQNVAAYQAGELTGYVSVAATASQKFYIAAQFSKNAAGTDYNLSYQTSGESPVSGFSMTVTAAGLIQITLPSVTGFSAASITYGLNVPAVGATFPLSIQASKVAGATDGVAVAAGFIGELITTTSAGGISILGTIANVASVSLGAGVWDVSGWFLTAQSGASGTTEVYLAAAISTVSATMQAPDQRSSFKFGGAGLPVGNAPSRRLVLSASTTIYFVAESTTLVAGGLSALSVTSASSIYSRRIA